MNIKECCKKTENLVVVERRGSLTIRKCTVCECKHYEHIAEPVHVGVKL